MKKRGGGVNPGRVATQAHVSEAVVAQAYADCWGMLVPPYESSGSGWWRPRYTFAADARSVTYAPVADAERIGEAYLRVALEPESVGGMSDRELARLAEHQYLEQVDGSGTYGEASDSLGALLERAAGSR